MKIQGGGGGGGPVLFKYPSSGRADRLCRKSVLFQLSKRRGQGHMERNLYFLVEKTDAEVAVLEQDMVPLIFSSLLICEMCVSCAVLE